MSAIANRIAVVLFVLGLAGGRTLYAQPPVPPAPPEAAQVPAPPAPLPAPPDVEASQDFQTFRYARPVVRIGTPFVLGPSGEVGDTVVLMADTTIEGHIFGDLVVVLGNVTLGSTAVVDNSVVVVGGTVTVASGAAIDDELVIVGGALDAPVGFMPGGEHVLIGPPALGDALRSISPWFTRGLLWGRVIVPGLPWMWTAMLVFLLIYLALALAFPAAVRACAQTLSTRPLQSFFTGMLTLLLIGPVSAILAISFVGIVVIPFAVCAVIMGWVLGKVGVARWIGGGIVAQDEPDSKGQGIRSVLIGFAVISVAYMVPILGLAAWTLVGVFGLGTATLTLISGLKRERPAPRPRQPVPVPEPPVFTPDTSSAPGPAAAEVGAPLAASMADEVPLAGAVAATLPPPAPPPPPQPGVGAPAGAVDLTAFPRATFLDRLAASVLDLLLVAIAYNLVSWRHDEGVFFILLFGYHVAFWVWKATTVGGIICNLRFVRTDGTPMRPADALVRGLASLFSAAALGLGFLWILRDPDWQAWHDKIAGTFVVSVPRNWPLT